MMLSGCHGVAMQLLICLYDILVSDFHLLLQIRKKKIYFLYFPNIFENALLKYL